MTAAPTPRDGESNRELATVLIDYLAHTSTNELADDRLGFTKAAFERMIAVSFAQRVAEAVGPLEKEIADLKNAVAIHDRSANDQMFQKREAESARDSLAALVVRLKEPLQDIRTALDNGDAETAWHVMDRQGDKALSLVPTDLSDSVCVKRSEWEKDQSELKLLRSEFDKHTHE